MFKAIACKSREEWLEARKGYITASNVPTLVGENPYQSPLSLYAEMTGALPPKEENEAMKFGRKLQPVIRDAYCEETKRTVEDLGEYTLLVSERFPWLAATLDYKILPQNGKPEGALEAKSTGFLHKADWEGRPPVRHVIQNQAQLTVTGWSWGSIAGLIGGQKFLWSDIEYDKDFEVIMLEITKEFHRRVELRDPPQADDWSESTKNALAALFPEEKEGLVVPLPAEAEEWHMALEQAKIDSKDAKEREDRFKNLLKQAIGEAEGGVLADGRYTFKKVHKEPYTVKAQDYRELRWKKAK